MRSDRPTTTARTARPRRHLTAVGAAVTVIAALVLAAAPTDRAGASASSLPRAVSAAATSDVVTFGFVGESVQTYDIGQNVAWIGVEAAGAGGAYNAITPDMGKSEGALVTGTLQGDACDQLLISVAQAGTPAGGNPNGGSPSSGAGGWGGLGASGGDGPGDSSDHLRSAGGGGGATTVQCVSGQTTSTIAVAGGGGGDGGASGDDSPRGGGGSAGLGGTWTGGAGAHGSEILGGIGGGAAIEPTGQGGNGGSGTDLGGHGGGGGGGVKGGGGGGGAGGTSAGGGGGAGSSVAALPLEDWGVTITGVNWNNSSSYPNGWVDLTLHLKPVPSLAVAIENTTITEGESIGSVAATLPTDATGTVAFADITDATNPVSLGSATVSEGGAVLAQPGDLLPGDGVHTIQASYSGDGTYSSTSANATVTVNAAADTRASTSVTATAATIAAGTTPVVHVSVAEIDPAAASRAAGGVPEGTVRVRREGEELTRGDLVAGTVDLQLAPDALEPGTHALEVEYLGSSVHRPSSTTVEVTVVAADGPPETTTVGPAASSGGAGTSTGTLARTGTDGTARLLALGVSLLGVGLALTVGRRRLDRGRAGR